MLDLGPKVTLKCKKAVFAMGYHRLLLSFDLFSDKNGVSITIPATIIRSTCGPAAFEFKLENEYLQLLKAKNIKVSILLLRNKVNIGLGIHNNDPEVYCFGLIDAC